MGLQFVIDLQVLDTTCFQTSVIWLHDGIIQPQATDVAGAFRQVLLKTEGVLVGIRS